MKHWILIASLGLCSWPLQAEQIYQWVDKNGVLQFSQEPPPAEVNALSREIAAPSSGTDDTAPTAEEAEIAAEAGETNDPEVKQALEQATSEQLRQYNCEKAKEYVTLLKNKNTPVAKVDGQQDSEQPNIMNAEQRAAALQTAEANVQEFCAPPKTEPAAAQ